MALVRVREDVQATVFSEAHGGFVPLVPGEAFDSADKFVKANAWAFESDIESATSKPGEKRNVRRPASVSVAPAE
jgi:hypothetical protein